MADSPEMTRKIDSPVGTVDADGFHCPEYEDVLTYFKNGIDEIYEYHPLFSEALAETYAKAFHDLAKEAQRAYYASLPVWD
jgi:hypothetical protein